MKIAVLSYEILDIFLKRISSIFVFILIILETTWSESSTNVFPTRTQSPSRPSTDYEVVNSRLINSLRLVHPARIALNSFVILLATALMGHCQPLTTPPQTRSDRGINIDPTAGTGPLEHQPPKSSFILFGPKMVITFRRAAQIGRTWLASAKYWYGCDTKLWLLLDNDQFEETFWLKSNNKQSKNS